MKKLLILPLLLMAAAQLLAQQSVMFKMAYQPKTTYTIDKQIKTTMNMAGPEALAAVSGGQGLALEMKMTTTSTIITSTRGQEALMPVKFVTKTGDVKMTMNGQEMPSGSIPADAATVSVFGKFTGDDKLLVDSVGGQKPDDSLRVTMGKLLESVQNGVKFPDHPLKVGDTFTQEMPFSVPMPGMGNSDITTKMNYTLISITANIAVFDFTETIGIAMNQPVQNQSMQMKMTGLGNGSLSYDISKQFFTTMANNLSLDFNMNMSGMDMKGKGIVATTDKVTIAGN